MNQDQGFGVQHPKAGPNTQQMSNLFNFDNVLTLVQLNLFDGQHPWWI
jgi:hypothetical protein